MKTAWCLWNVDKARPFGAPMSKAQAERRANRIEERTQGRAHVVVMGVPA